MYTFKQDGLKNQQKKRTLQTKINKNNWFLKSYYSKSLHAHILSNYQSIDLRIYKLLLRKFKKKLLKKHIQVFLFLQPNYKISNKSKNSRMGKGKGMFNRYYARLLNFKPIFLIKNVNNRKYFKIIKKLKKYFKYKINKMLKLSIIFKNKIKFKNSKSHLCSIYKRLYMWQILFFKTTNNSSFIKIKTKNFNFSNKICLIRSPFHYKTSKTIINSNYIHIKFDFFCYTKQKNKTLINNNIIRTIYLLNKNDVCTINKIQIKQI